MTRAELRYVLARHEKWLRHPDSGARANLSGANLSEASLRGANLRGANLDYSSWPLWCGSLHAKAYDRLVVQLLYHVLSLAQASSVSVELKEALDTDALIEQANRFHRVDECGQLNRWPKQDRESHERTAAEAEQIRGRETPLEHRNKGQG